MTTVQQAHHTILINTLPTTNQAIHHTQAHGHILAEPLIADRPFPPFHRVTMDGIAIAHQQFQEGQRQFPIVDTAPAGAPQRTLYDPTHCIEVMTGAVLPKGTDTVIRYEDLQISNRLIGEKDLPAQKGDLPTNQTDNIATIQVEKIKPQQNVHHTGTDCPEGATLVEPGSLIDPSVIGVATTIGKEYLTITAPPKVVIIATGDELVEVNLQPLPHQIRHSNIHTIATSLNARNISTHTIHLVDDPDTMTHTLRDILTSFDVLIISGGVSKGKFDYVPTVLEKLGIRKLFHGVQQRPGKPFWFGTSRKNTSSLHPEKVVFALPGNPVSSYMCTIRYIHPWFDKVLGLLPSPPPYALLTEEVHFRPDLTYFLQVQTQYTSSGQLLAQPRTGKGSGDLANLTTVNAFIELPRGKDIFRKGEAYPLYWFR